MRRNGVTNFFGSSRERSGAVDGPRYDLRRPRLERGGRAGSRPKGSGGGLKAPCLVFLPRRRRAVVLPLKGGEYGGGYGAAFRRGTARRSLSSTANAVIPSTSQIFGPSFPPYSLHTTAERPTIT